MANFACPFLKKKTIPGLRDNGDGRFESSCHPLPIKALYYEIVELMFPNRTTCRCDKTN